MEYKLAQEPEVSLILSGDGEITQWSDTARSIFRIESEEIIGHSWTELFDGEGNTELGFHRLLNHARTGDTTTFEVRAARTDVPLIVTLIGGNKLNDVDSIVLFIRKKPNVSPLLHFLGNGNLVDRLNHGVRTSLSNILGYLDILESSERDPNDLKLLNSIRTGSKEVLFSIENLLQLSYIETGFLKPVSSACDPRWLATEAKNAAAKLYQERELDFSVRIEESVPLLFQTDPRILMNILLELLRLGAENATDSKVSLKLDYSSRFDQEMLEVQLIDNGSELNRACSEILFVPNPDSSMTNVELSLSLIRGWVVLLNGKLKVESTGAEGIKIIAQVPGSQREASSAKRLISRGSTCPGKPRILYVEDNVDNQKVVQLLLKLAGYEIELANNGEEGVEQVLIADRTGNPFDIVLMDLQMPVMDGIEATSHLREAGFDRPIIAFTAAVATFDRQTCLNAGFDDYVTKPFSGKDLSRVIKTWCGCEAEGLTSTSELPKPV